MENKWAIILGCSTGHGAAIAKQLATEGYGIIGFHLDRGSITVSYTHLTLPTI